MEKEYPNITVDAAVFSYIDEKLHILQIKRNIPPYENMYALAGAFIKDDETADEAVVRMLKDETGLEVDYLEQLYTFTNPVRDPRQRIISIAYYGLINSTNQTLKTSRHAKEVEWVEIKKAFSREMAFDHRHIMHYALQRLRNKLQYEPIGFELLPTYFTMTELYDLYCAILDEGLDRRNFSRKILSFGLLKETQFKKTGTVGRQAKMYEFDKINYDRLKTKGFNFEL
jgi:8-oxo-dGTP diphosphatase